MQLCATVNIYLNAEGKPSVQFEPREEYKELPVLQQAMMAHAAVQISMLVVKELMALNPEQVEDICQHIAQADLTQGMVRPN